MDRTPDLSSLERYRAQGAEDMRDVPETKTAAYLWAVREHNVESLKAKYSGRSYLYIAKKELDLEVEALSAAQESLQAEANRFQPVIAELRKVQAETANGGRSNDLMGGYAYSATITNSSQLSFSSIRWQAALYLDGSTQPTATGTTTSSFEEQGGLKPGQAVNVRLTQDTFFSKDWDTLAVRNAKQQRVVLTLSDAFDFNNKSYLAGAPFQRLRQTESALANARKHREALQD